MKARLLLADPDKSLHGAYADFFSRAGFDVETAADGVECIGKLRLAGAEVLVVDADLAWGGADGVLDRVSGDPNVPWVPVTIATGITLPDELVKQFELPPQWCLRKPYRMETLLERIDAALLTDRDQE